jgi:hypothetical protein
MYNYCFDYDKCRDIFLDFENDLKEYYSSVQKRSNTVQDACFIDSFLCENKNNNKILMITTGEHGIEGYAGNVFLQMFIKEYLPILKHNGISVILIHAINPWGMKHKRSVNENNVDLNRNFVWERHNLGNRSFMQMKRYFTKRKPVRKSDLNLTKSFLELIPYMTKLGKKGIKEALAKGQFVEEKSVYYGGEKDEKSTEYMKEIYDEVYNNYEFVLHLDIHTGAGPKNKMSIVNSAFSNKESNVWEKDFGYSPVVKTDKNSFYEIKGDMIDYIYKKYEGEHYFYSTCFEYGTYGEGLGGLIKTIKSLVVENQEWHYGSSNSKVKEKVDKMFRGLFYPDDDNWKQSFEEDTRRGLNGVLKYFDFFR